MLPTRQGVSPSCVALPQGPWPTVLDFLCERLPAVSRVDWVRRMTAGEVVTHQGVAIQPTQPYLPQTKLYYWRELPFEHPIPFEERVIYQDDWLVVADKPHFLPITPKGRYLHETLLVRLKRQLGIDTLVPAHRLDRETAGLVLFTVQPASRHAYQSLFRDRLVRKVYEAVAPYQAGLPWPQWRRSRLQESERFMAMEEVPGEPNAHTWINLTEVKGPWARYELRPITGQKHQLRAHMNALGLPLHGDRIYPVLQPAEPPDAPLDFSHPLKLLARELSFTDPISGEERRFTSQRTLPWPDEDVR